MLLFFIKKLLQIAKSSRFTKKVTKSNKMFLDSNISFKALINVAAPYKKKIPQIAKCSKFTKKVTKSKENISRQ